MVVQHKKRLITHKQTTTMHNEKSNDTDKPLDYWHDADRDDTPPDNYDEVFDIEVGGWED